MNTLPLYPHFVDETITKSAPEIENTTNKTHTQAECIISLFP